MEQHTIRRVMVRRVPLKRVNTPIEQLSLLGIPRLFQVNGSSQGATSTHMRPSRHTDIIAQDFGGRVEPDAVQGNKKTETCVQTFQIEITSTNQLNLGISIAWDGVDRPGRKQSSIWSPNRHDFYFLKQRDTVLCVWLFAISSKLLAGLQVLPQTSGISQATEQHQGSCASGYTESTDTPHRSHSQAQPRPSCKIRR